MGFAGYVIIAASVLIVVGLIGVYIVVGLIGVYHEEKKKKAAIEELRDSVNASRCEICGAEECDLFIFYTFRFIGIAPIVYSYTVEPHPYVHCPDHARETAVRLCRSIGLNGHWGFPGFIAAVWYVVKNLRELSKGGLLTLTGTLNRLIQGVLLGWVLLALGLALFLLLLIPFI